MSAKIRLTESMQKLLCCPICKAKIIRTQEEFICSNPECNGHFPIIDGVPVLLNEERSVFSIDDFILRQDTTFQLNLAQRNEIKELLKHLKPGISKNLKAKQNYIKFGDLLFQQATVPNVLVVGGSILGEGMEPLLKKNDSIDIVETDVSFGPRTMLISDGHDIPFEDEVFDGVIVQAVLEHVVDPVRCVDEIHRVLKQNGLVYAETPFMQQVHMGRYDFTRFTHLGHRRLFRRFEEINSGPVAGPGMALAWAYKYFLLSFTSSRQTRQVVSFFAHLTSFYLKYFDSYLIEKPGAFDAASGFYFMGRKSRQFLPDRELINLYKGAI